MALQGLVGLILAHLALLVIVKERLTEHRMWKKGQREGVGSGHTAQRSDRPLTFPILLLISCVTLVNSLSLSVPQFSHWKHSINIYHTRLP